MADFTDDVAIDLRDQGVDDLLRIAKDAAGHYLGLRRRGEALERLKALEEMCAALDVVRRLLVDQRERAGAGVLAGAAT